MIGESVGGFKDTQAGVKVIGRQHTGEMGRSVAHHGDSDTIFCRQSVGHGADVGMGELHLVMSPSLGGSNVGMAVHADMPRGLVVNGFLTRQEENAAIVGGRQLHTPFQEGDC